METQAASDTLAERARRFRRQGLSALGVPLGVKVLAILTILNGIGYLLSGVLSIVAPTQWEGSFAAGLANSLFSLILAGALGALSVWCGRSLYGGSRIALDIVIGAWGATLIFNTIMAFQRAPLWAIVIPLIFYGGILFYLIRCRPVLLELHSARNRRERHRVRRTASGNQ